MAGADPGVRDHRRRAVIAEAVRAVVFDIGETLVDRRREWAGWARWFGVSPHTFSAVFGAAVAAGGGVAQVIEHFHPGGDYAQLRPGLVAAGLLGRLDDSDLYPGARAAMNELRTDGVIVGIAGNQPAAMGDEIRALGLAVDFVALSGELGVAKPAPRFFAEAVRRCGAARQSVVYVGDQLDNDVVGAQRAGLRVVRVLTGPWGQLQRDATLEAGCDAVVASVADVPATLRASR